MSGPGPGPGLGEEARLDLAELVLLDLADPVVEVVVVQCEECEVTSCSLGLTGGLL